MSLMALVLLFLSVFTQSEPEWINYDARNLKYSQDTYFIGFSSRYYDEGEDINEVLKEVKQMSRMELSESVFLSINSVSSLKISSTNESTDTDFEKNSVTKSSLDAYGMKTETHVDEDQKVAYGFSFIKKKTLASGYYNKFYAKVSELKSMMKDIDNIVDDEKKYSQLTKGMNILRQLDNDENILIFLGVSPSVLLPEDRKYFKSLIREKFGIIRSSQNQTLGQRIQYLLDDMATELGDIPIQFSVSPVTYKNTGITSEFSDYLYQLTNSKVSERFKVAVSFDANLRMTGSYWPTEDEIQLTLNLHEYAGDEPMFLKFGGSFSVDPEEVKKLGLEYEVKKSGVDLQKHYEILNPTTANGGMEARILTHKGSQALIFKEGESLKLFVDVSRPAYLRLVNIWSDGTQISLLENYYIRKDKTNQLIELPFDWQTTCPCGTEYIKLLAQSEPFNKMNIVTKDGMDYVHDGITEMITKTRSFQQANASTEDFYYAESGFSITTLPARSN